LLISNNKTRKFKTKTFVFFLIFRGFPLFSGNDGESAKVFRKCVQQISKNTKYHDRLCLSVSFMNEPLPRNMIVHPPTINAIEAKPKRCSRICFCSESPSQTAITKSNAAKPKLFTINLENKDKIFILKQHRTGVSNKRP
jgi:hypothetical protein